MGVGVGVEWRSLAVSYRPFFETRVSSSGETWQAKLIGSVIISAAQG